MTITDIEKKESEERKREKRLVRMTNVLTREFIDSLKIKAKSQRTFTEYLTKGFLDYIFFVRHKEIGEMNETHIRQFLFEFAPQRLSFDKDSGKEIPEIIKKLLNFLDETGYIKNSSPLIGVIEESKKEFNKIIQVKKQTVSKKELKTEKVMPEKTEPKVGRNDPCPCGSGKKYKKCCGKNL